MWLRLYFCWTACWSRLSTWPFLPALLKPHWSMDSSGVLLPGQALFWNGIEQSGIHQGFTRPLSWEGTHTSILSYPPSFLFSIWPHLVKSNTALQPLFHICYVHPPALLKVKNQSLDSDSTVILTWESLCTEHPSCHQDGGSIIKNRTTENKNCISYYIKYRPSSVILEMCCAMILYQMLSKDLEIPR